MKTLNPVIVQGLSIQTRQPPSRTLVQDISLQIEPGRIMAIIGESGAGKTVLARCLAGWLPAGVDISAGSISIGGQQFSGAGLLGMSKLRGRGIGYVGGDPSNALDPTLPVGAQLIEKLRAVKRGLSKHTARQQVLDLLHDVRIPSPEARMEEYPFQFSGGMLQRVMIVDALLGEPAFLIADNITQPLDVTIGAQILRLMRRVALEHRTAILYLTNSPAIARDVADDIAVLADTRMVEQAASAVLVKQPQHEATLRLIAQQPGIWAASAPRREKVHEVRSPSMAVLDVAQTYYHRKRAVQAVRQATFDVFPGENFALVGESGCGKSTLTRMLSWLEKPERGDIELFGTSLSSQSRKQITVLRKDFQLLLQDPFNSLPPRMTVGRMIAESLLIHGGVAKKDIRARVLATMQEVGLDGDLYDQLALGLNGAQRQRIAIARALILEPKLIILDETLSSLDPGEQQKLLQLFDRLQQAHDLTYIFISHDLAMVRRSCDRIAVMYLGEIVEIADNQTLFSNPAHPYTRALLSAVSTLESNPFDPLVHLLEGEPPSPIDIPEGCAFRSRCPIALPVCAGVSPPLLKRAGQPGFVACHNTDDAQEQAEMIARGGA